MKGKRTDLHYNDIVKFISDNQPLIVAKLHTYLMNEHEIHQSCSRSRIIAKLESLNLIERTGKKPSRQCTFNTRTKK
jgi:hypothetical protein